MPLTGEIVFSSLSQVIRFLFIVAGSIAGLEIVLYVVLKRWLKYKYAIAFLLLAPAMAGLLLLQLYPFGFNVWLAFSNMSMFRFKTFTISWQNGLGNFLDVFRAPILQSITFFPLLGRTLLWTAVNVLFHVTGGLLLALLLNRPLRGKGIYRTLLVVPWAIPQVIAALAWRSEFHYQYGFVNLLLEQIGLKPVPWLTDPVWSLMAVILVNIWLGIPFMMVIILGGLQSISKEYYDAAQIDGASGWQQFARITMPLLRPVLTPAIILGVVWTFNNFNVIFLVNQGGPMEGTDILVTALYKAVFQFYRYGFGAAFSLVMFLFLFAFAAIYVRLSGALKGAYE